jgi:hypothetical protein
MDIIMNTFLCPHCNKEVEISQAFKHQIREELSKELKDGYIKELEEQKENLKKSTEERLKKEFDFKFKNYQSESEENKKKASELQEQLLEMTKLIRQLKDKDQQRELELQKRLLDEREKIQEETSKIIQEKSNLEKSELQKQLNDTKKALEEAQRKVAQKSQQLQGEVLELDLETRLIENYPSDEIVPVPKGIEGADIIQKVKNKFGQLAGTIIWETKRTKQWGKDWALKLREDKRRTDSSAAILVSDILPDGIVKFGYFENIWVTTHQYALPLVEVLRMGLFELAVAKSTSAHKDERLEALFTYLTKDTFRNRFETQVENIILMQTDLETERRSTVRLWKRREMQIKRLISNVSSMYGELQGILGQSLPSISSLDSKVLLAEASGQENLLD